MSSVIIKKQTIIIPLLLFFIGFFFTKKVNAASLSNISDMLTTDRPSASAPIYPAETRQLGRLQIQVRYPSFKRFISCFGFSDICCKHG